MTVFYNYAWKGAGSSEDMELICVHCGVRLGSHNGTLKEPLCHTEHVEAFLEQKRVRDEELVALYKDAKIEDLEMRVESLESLVRGLTDRLNEAGIL